MSEHCNNFTVEPFFSESGFPRLSYSETLLDKLKLRAARGEGRGETMVYTKLGPLALESGVGCLVRSGF